MELPAGWTELYDEATSHSYYYKSHVSHKNASALMELPGNDSELADRLADSNPYSGLELVHSCLSYDRGNLSCEMSFVDSTLYLKFEYGNEQILRVRFEDECAWKEEAGLMLEGSE